MDTVCDQRTQGQGHSGSGLQEPFFPQTLSLFFPHSSGGHCGRPYFLLLPPPPPLFFGGGLNFFIFFLGFLDEC